METGSSLLVSRKIVESLDSRFKKKNLLVSIVWKQKQKFTSVMSVGHWRVLAFRLLGVVISVFYSRY